MISVKSSGSFKNTESFLLKMSKMKIDNILHRAGREGVAALVSATPKNSGLAASSWDYEITHSRKGVSLVWTNSDNETGFPVAIMLQHGYATGNGGYVEGRDYINPAIKPIFDRISEMVWREVTNA